MDKRIIRYSSLSDDEIETHFTNLKVENLYTVIHKSLNNAKFCYPSFNYWLKNKVMPDLSLRKRDILFIFDEYDKKLLIGIAILKFYDEKKICSFRISYDYQRMGYGKMLMDECMQILGTKTPMITVPDDTSISKDDPKNCYTAFSNFFKKHYKGKFSCIQRLKDYYCPGITEYVFNGVLPVK